MHSIKSRCSARPFLLGHGNRDFDNWNTLTSNTGTPKRDLAVNRIELDSTSILTSADGRYIFLGARNRRGNGNRALMMYCRKTDRITVHLPKPVYVEEDEQIDGEIQTIGLFDKERKICIQDEHGGLCVIGLRSRKTFIGKNT